MTESQSTTYVVVEVTQEEAARAAAVVQRLRDFFRGGTSSLEEVRVSALIEGAVAQMRDFAAHAGITLETVSQVDCGKRVIADKQRLMQIVLNLVSNAVKFTREGAVLVSLERLAETVTIRISDTGPGISPSVMQRMFEPFVTTKETGIGLGLSICQHVAAAHGGTLCAKNRVGGGAEFTLLLPFPDE